MAKMTAVILLAALTTSRTIDGKETRVTFQPGVGKNGTGKAVEITDAEKKDLDALTKQTGRAHYRMPVDESVQSAEDATDEVEEEFEGQNVAIDQKNVAQLKAYLDFHSVAY